MAETFDTWAPKLAKRLRAMPKTIQKSMSRSALVQEAEAKRLAPRRKGQLQRMIKARIQTGAGAGSVLLSMPAKYAPLEFGADIRPKRRQWLAVPIQPATVGMPGPRSDTVDLFVLTARDGRKFLASKIGGAIDLRWRLLKQARITGVGFMSAGQKKGADTFQTDVLDSVERELLNV